MGKMKERASKHIDFESDNEELQDEIHQFHQERTKVNESTYRRQKNKDPREVLNVEGDLSDHKNEFSDDEGSDFDPNDGVDVNKWGNQRKDYYGTGFVDQDFGGMTEQDLYSAQLEEDDVIGRQKYFDKIAASVTDMLDEDDDEEQDGKKETFEVTNEWSLKSAKKLNKNYNKLLTEYNQRSELMSVIVQPLTSIVQKLPGNSVLAKQITLTVEIYANYLMTLLMVLKQKSASFSSKKLTDEAVDAHPAIGRLAKFKAMISEVDSFLENNSEALQKLQTADSTEKIAMLLTDLKLHVPESRSKKLQEDSAEIEVDVDEEEEGEVDENGERRAVPKFIAKNSESVKAKKKKNKISRTANKHKYKKITGKVRSQIGVIKTENAKYQGESRGIKKGLIRSTKLVA